VQPEGQTAPLRPDTRGQQCVARRGAQALADPVGEAQQQQPRPARHQRHQRPPDACQSVAEHDPRLGALRSVDHRTREQLEQAGGRLGDALDQAQRARPGHQHRRQVERDQRIQHLGGRVVHQTDESDQPDGAGQGAK